MLGSVGGPEVVSQAIAADPSQLPGLVVAEHERVFAGPLGLAVVADGLAVPQLGGDSNRLAAGGLGDDVSGRGVLDTSYEGVAGDGGGLTVDLEQHEHPHAAGGLVVLVQDWLGLLAHDLDGDGGEAEFGGPAPELVNSLLQIEKAVVRATVGRSLSVHTPTTIQRPKNEVTPG